jgi:phosphate-selective porin OprO/OprP
MQSTSKELTMRYLKPNQRSAAGSIFVCWLLWQLLSESQVFAEYPSAYLFDSLGTTPYADVKQGSITGDEPRENWSNRSASGSHCDSFQQEPETLSQKLNSLGRLYKNDRHPIFQECWFLGRYHGQAYHADGGGAQDYDWENRRFRIGSQATLFNQLTLHAQMVSGFDMDPFYNGFTELWAQWAYDSSFVMALGQQKHRFTHDRTVSSRYINTLERSMLLNMFNADYTPAITASGQTERFAYYTGVFSNATGPDMWEAFTNYDSGYSLLASGTWGETDKASLDQAYFNLCYLYSDSNPNATNLNRYKNGLSAALILTKGPASLVSEALLGLQSSDGNAFGINIQPGYFFTEKLQLAMRYQLAIADEDDGLLAQSRYEQAVGLSTGDLYQAGYAGLNYYVAGHRIKLMNGIEYANMNGQDVWTVSLALRIFWGPDSSGPFPSAAVLKPRS